MNLPYRYRGLGLVGLLALLLPWAAWRFALSDTFGAWRECGRLERRVDALAVAEAEYRAMCAFDKYGSGVWPAGTYVERYGGGEATVRVEPYRQYRDVQLITIEVRIDGSRKRIVHRQLVECAE